MLLLLNILLSSFAFSSDKNCQQFEGTATNPAYMFVTDYGLMPVHTATGIYGPSVNQQSVAITQGLVFNEDCSLLYRWSITTRYPGPLPSMDAKQVKEFCQTYERQMTEFQKYRKRQEALGQQLKNAKNEKQRSAILEKIYEPKAHFLTHQQQYCTAIPVLNREKKLKQKPLLRAYVDNTRLIIETETAGSSKILQTIATRTEDSIDLATEEFKTHEYFRPTLKTETAEKSETEGPASSALPDGGTN